MAEVPLEASKIGDIDEGGRREALSLHRRYVTLSFAKSEGSATVFSRI
jgi:hypothetical protein